MTLIFLFHRYVDKKFLQATFEKIRFEVSYLLNEGKKLEQITKGSMRKRDCIDK